MIESETRRRFIQINLSGFLSAFTHIEFMVAFIVFCFAFYLKQMVFLNGPFSAAKDREPPVGR